MDTVRFDRIARMVGITTTRRGVHAVALAAMTAQVVDRGTQTQAKNKKRKVQLCLSGQNLTVGKKAKKRYLTQGAAIGACAAPPPPTVSPPPPVAYCAGKNTCAADAPCNASGPQCYCFSRGDAGHIGEAICGQSVDTAPTCDACPAGSICVLGGGMCGEGYICVTACPNPR